MNHNSIAAALIVAMLGVAPAAALDLTITVKGIRNAKGKVAALAFVEQDGFPDQIPKAKAQAVSDAKQGTVTLTLKNVPAGKVAVTVLHDENANGKLNRNLFGIPLEGVGMSGKPPGNRPPTFADVVIDVKKSQKLEITLKYW
jgi:uncharacterized protein (DUF2141 family)